MNSKSIYLDRYAWPEPLFPGEIISHNTGIIVVLPAYNEPEIILSIQSLQRCIPPECDVLIIVLFNESMDEKKEISEVNTLCHTQVQSISGQYPILSKIVKLPNKKAGVGLARKIGMDEAVRMFHQIGKAGIITCFDADSICDSNFLIAIEKHFKNHNNQTGLVFYEHPTDRENSEAIINYELYLRYYVDALRWAGFPYAFQTLGSCISVHSEAYQKQGGMNTRKAGEDFYFIHKMVSLGGVGEINTTIVRPSSRLSDRVPFGTGHALERYLLDEVTAYQVYSPETFKDLRSFIQHIPIIYSNQSIEDVPLPHSIESFLAEQAFSIKLKEVIKETSSIETFKKRLFTWFDGLKVLKYVHFSRDFYHPQVDLDEALEWLDEAYCSNKLLPADGKEILTRLRKIDRQTHFYIR